MGTKLNLFVLLVTGSGLNVVISSSLDDVVVDCDNFLLIKLFLPRNLFLNGNGLSCSMSSLLSSLPLSSLLDGSISLGLDILSRSLPLGLENNVFLGSSSTFSVVVVVVVVLSVVVGSRDGIVTGEDTGALIAIASPASPIVGNRELNKSSAS